MHVCHALACCLGGGAGVRSFVVPACLVRQTRACCCCAATGCGCALLLLDAPPHRQRRLLPGLLVTRGRCQSERGGLRHQRAGLALLLLAVTRAASPHSSCSIPGSHQETERPSGKPGAIFFVARPPRSSLSGLCPGLSRRPGLARRGSYTVLVRPQPPQP
jgi:hypothetical protein